MITEEFDEETPPAYLAANERLYKALGLIARGRQPPRPDPRPAERGVAGFYANDEGKLYVVSKTGVPGPIERITFAHEYDHALQDQHTTVFKDQDGILDQARPDPRPAGGLRGRRDAADDASGRSRQLDLGRPAELLELASDPEAAGAARADAGHPARDAALPVHDRPHVRPDRRSSRAAGPAVDAFYERMPASTEQILHPESLRGERGASRSRPAGRPRRRARRRLVGPDRGHLRRVPARDLAARGGHRRRRRRRPRRPAGAATASRSWTARTVPGRVVLETAWDSDARCGRVRDAAQTAVDELANPGADRHAGRRHGHDPGRVGRGDAARSRRRSSERRASDAGAGRAARYIDSGAEIPSRPRALARVIRAAPARARRAADRSGASGSTTRASR